MTQNPCPCGSSREYPDCCSPLHSGAAFASSAEMLMRSRYCAYVKGEIKYLAETLLPEERPTFSLKSAKEWSDSAEWLGLSVLKARGGQNDQKGEVEFIARFRQNGRDEEHHEVSTFVKRNERWFFADGRVVQKPGAIVSRNAQCPCGSGKKFKRCCG